MYESSTVDLHLMPTNDNKKQQIRLNGTLNSQNNLILSSPTARHFATRDTNINDYPWDGSGIDPIEEQGGFAKVSVSP